MLCYYECGTKEKSGSLIGIETIETMTFRTPVGYLVYGLYGEVPLDRVSVWPLCPERSTVLTRISAAALIKFFAPQVRRLIEGGACQKKLDTTKKSYLLI